jgi:transcriptional repressor NrdR
MKCPYCNYKETKVVDKRENAEGTTRRRRECLKCKKRFTTYEKVENIDLSVIKKDNTRQEFDRSKIEKGITRACEKRPISYEQVKKIVDEIEAELRLKKTKEIQSKEIGELVMKKLKKLDKIAYIRFASVYREFADVSSFEEELKKLIKR